MITNRRLIGFIFLIFILATPLGAATIIVPDNYATIQGAIQASVDGDAIRVRPGTYVENIDFLGKAITVKSIGEAVDTTIDGDMNGSVVTFAGGEGQGSVISGFTLMNGIGTFDHVELRTLGGGIYCLDSSPTIEWCRVIGNSANHGGGIYCSSGSPRIVNSFVSYNDADIGGGIFCRAGTARISETTIRENIADFYGGGIYCWEASPAITSCAISQNETGTSGDGGGIYIHGFSHPTILRNLIVDNSTPGQGGGICCTVETDVLIRGNQFSGNYGNFGGAVCCRDDAGLITIVGNTMTENEALTAGGGIFSENSPTLIRDNIIMGNDGGGYGGGIYQWSGSPSAVSDIRRNRVENNMATDGGGICVGGNVPNLTDCHIAGNSATNGGGLMADFSVASTVVNNSFHDNQAVLGGGVLLHWCGALTLDSNTFTANTADQGGGIYCGENTSLTVVNSIFWNDTSPDGQEIYLDFETNGSSLNIDYCDVDGGIGSLVVETGCTLNWGEGMIDDDPLFVSGPGGDLCLSQAAAGQTLNSPCVNAGDPSMNGATGYTRSDALSDMGVVDLGVHYGGGRLLVGAGPGEDNLPVVRLFPLQQDATHDLELLAYGADSYGVNVHACDYDGDGVDEILTGAGPGAIYGPHVRGFTASGLPISGISFLAYGTSRYGVNVAAGDLDGDGRDEIVAGAGPGEVFGPHVRAFDLSLFPPEVTAMPGVSYFAYGTLKYGVNVACGDIDGDGFDEIVTGAGPGAVFGPHVRGWNVDGGTATAITGVSYFAYGSLKYGVRVACGDIDGDGIDEIATAPGPSTTFAPHIRGWNYDGSAVTPMPNCSFFALPASQYSFGAQLFAGQDLDGDGRAEIVVGAGPDPAADAKVAVYRYNDWSTAQWFTLQAMPAEWRYGATVAAGHF